MDCERTHWNTWLGVEGEKWEEKDTGFSQAGWMAEATSLDMGWEEEGVQKPTPFLPDPAGTPTERSGQKLSTGEPLPLMAGGC